MSSDPFNTLFEIIRQLIGPNGCPWDKEQTPASLCEYILEESYELVDAIRHGHEQDVCEEAGDVFFLLAFIITLYEQRGNFGLHDVLQRINEKMIRRHPHVFANATFSSRSEQLAAWEEIKQKEKVAASAKQNTFSSLPSGLPPLLKAYRIHSKAARAGFTWDNDQDVEQQVEAEWLELLDAFSHKEITDQAHELGDLLFTLVELGRRKGIKANAALDASANRFLQRFFHMETEAAKQGKKFFLLSIEEKNALWDKAKQNL